MIPEEIRRDIYKLASVALMTGMLVDREAERVMDWLKTVDTGWANVIAEPAPDAEVGWVYLVDNAGSY